VLAWRNR